MTFVYLRAGRALDEPLPSKIEIISVVQSRDGQINISMKKGSS
jgi:hypothetical protein